MCLEIIYSLQSQSWPFLLNASTAAWGVGLRNPKSEKMFFIEIPRSYMLVRRFISNGITAKKW